MLTEEEWIERLIIEGAALEREQPTFKRVGNRWTHWKGAILGSGIYQDGVFVLEITIPREYPYKPPRVKFLTPIWHPNIFRDQICVGLLGKDWTPVNSLVDTVETIRFLLSNPNSADPLNTTASKQYIEDFDKFVQRAKSYAKKYATWNQEGI